MSRLVNAFLEVQLNGDATRPSLEAGRLLAVCQRCPGYSDCIANPAALAARLCDAHESCEPWEVRPDVL